MARFITSTDVKRPHQVIAIFRGIFFHVSDLVRVMYSNILIVNKLCRIKLVVIRFRLEIHTTFPCEETFPLVTTKGCCVWIHWTHMESICDWIHLETTGRYVIKFTNTIMRRTWVWQWKHALRGLWLNWLRAWGCCDWIHWKTMVRQ